MKKIVGIGLSFMVNQLSEVFKNIKGVQVSFYDSNLKDKEEQKKLMEVIKNETHLLFVGNISENEEQDNFLRKVNKEVNIPIIPIGIHAIKMGYYNVTSSMAGKIHKYFTYGGEKNLCSAINYVCYNCLYNDTEEGQEYKKAIYEPEFMPFNGIIHRETKEVFQSFEEYSKWYIENVDPREFKWVGILIHRSKWTSNNLEIENDLSEKLEKLGYKVVLAFSYSTSEEKYDIKNFHQVIEDYYSYKGKLIIGGLINFQMLSVSGELKEENLFEHEINNFKALNVPVFRPIISYYNDKKSWKESVMGISNEIAWSFTTPEMAGMIEPVILGCRGEDGNHVLIEEGVIRVTRRVDKWFKLKNTENKNKVITIMIHNSPCSGVEATIGKGLGLDVFNSVIKIMKKLKNKGYNINNIPEDGKELHDLIMNKKAFHDFRWTSVEDIVKLGGVLYEMSKKEYEEFYKEIPEDAREKMEEMWGKPIGEAMVHNDKLIITGLDFGNVKVMVQPKRGCYGAKCTGEVCKILHDPTCPPPHQYIATYRYIENILGSNAIINVGTGGSLEFLPGKSNALSDSCFPYIALGSLPSIYVYNASVGGEGTIAKRRSNSVIIDHIPSVIENISVNKRGKLHILGEALDNKDLLSVIHEYVLSNVEICEKLKLHFEDEEKYVEVLRGIIEDLINNISRNVIIDKLINNYSVKRDIIEEIIRIIEIEIMDISEKCSHMDNEINSLMNVLEGGYIEAGLSGSPSENLKKVLPTGRNMHLMDSDKVPTKEAYNIGVKLAEELIDKYKEENQGKLPEKIAMNMISTDISGAKGEQLSQILYLMGVRPHWNKWGKVTDIDIIPLEELKRPRIDVTVRISGVLRDAYPDAVNMIDKAALKVCDLEEPLNKNYIKRNTLRIKEELKKLKQVENLERRASIRVFGDKPGAYGAGVDLALKASAWEGEDDIAKIFSQFSSYAYGNNLNGNLAKREFVENVRDVDASYEGTNSKRFNNLNSSFVASVHGGFNAVKKVITGKDICQYHGSSEDKTKLRVGTMKDELKKNLDDTLFNEIWKETVKEDGYIGASDIMKAIQTVFDWQVLLKKIEDKDIDKLVDVYINDDEMRKWFEENNKYALEEIGRRFLELHERKAWNGDPEVLKKLKKNYLKMEGSLEETIENSSEDVQGGNIQVLSYKDVELWGKKIGEFGEIFNNK